jgi:hypothetical protein
VSYCLFKAFGFISFEKRKNALFNNLLSSNS